MMNVARDWESISNKIKILFRVPAKNTQSTFILLQIMAQMEKFKNQTDKTTVGEWDESNNI